MKKSFSFIVLAFALLGMMTTYIQVHGTTYFYGYIEDRLGNTITGVTVILADDDETILGYDVTDGSGYYSIGVTLNGNSPYSLTASKTGFEPEMLPDVSSGSNDFTLLDPIKIGVFFWATDAGQETYIDDYIDILEIENYEKFYKFKDSTDVESDCQDVEDFEYSGDKIFVYIIAHGYNTGSHSYSYFKANNNTQVYSNTFNGYMDDWAATRKSILVDSCFSGDWADDFAENPYLAMSSADETHYAWTYNNQSTPAEGDFSHHFFYAVEILEYNAVDAFDYACDEIDYVQNPKKQDYSSCTWFT